MVVMKEKTVVPLRVSGASKSPYHLEAQVRDNLVHLDEPVERGGTNSGASPMESVLAALAGCTNRIGHKVADMHGVEILGLSVQIVGKFDRRGTGLMEEVAVPFPEIVQKIELISASPVEAIEKLKVDLPKYCAVSKIIRESGTRLVDEWTVVKP